MNLLGGRMGDRVRARESKSGCRRVRVCVGFDWGSGFGIWGAVCYEGLKEKELSIVSDVQRAF